MRYFSIHKTFVKGDEACILLNCPNLERLLLGWGSIDALLDFSEYRASQQPLPVLNGRWDDVAALTSTLTDRTTPLARSERKLRIRLEYPRYSSTTYEALLQMLQSNETLEYLEVVVPYRQYAIDTRQQFLEHHLTPIWRAIEPLPMASKLAFVSVFASGSTRSQK